VKASATTSRIAATDALGEQRFRSTRSLVVSNLDRTMEVGNVGIETSQDAGFLASVTVSEGHCERRHIGLAVAGTGRNLRNTRGRTNFRQ
jgi:hypothetical protein